MSNKDWTDKLPGLFEGYTEAEPEGLWDAVQAGVAPKKRRIVAAWWFAGGGILAAAAVIALFVLLRPVTPVPSVTVVPGDVVAQAEDEIRRSEPANDVKVEPVNDVVANPTVIPSVPPVILSEANESSTEPLEDSHAQETLPDESVPISEESVTPTEDSPVIPVSDSSVIPDSDSSVIPGADRESPATRKPLPIKVQISLSTTGYMGQIAQNSTTGVGLPSTPGVRPNAAPPTKSATGGNGSSGMPMMLSRNKASTTDATHSQSARFAMGIRIGLTERWGVESGIVSSTLTSDFNSRAGNNGEYTKRTISYLGIPLYASYNLFQKGRLGIMVNAGPMYEFSTKTNTVKQSIIGYTQTGETTDDTLYDDTKWSMNLGAALQLRTGKHGALYVQPGFSYHFPDNSSLETFYTAHPAAFSITFGYNFLF